MTDLIPVKVIDEMNMELTRGFTKEEVVALFFQKYRSIVGTNVSNLVLNVLNHDMSVSEINKTNIALVPKNKNPQKMTDFRPNSLCNVVHKLSSKTLANRLKAILPFIMLENQSAFVANKLITDNILVAYEIMHYLKHKRGRNDSFMVIKLDMSKAFDRVEWSFIEMIMRKIGFDESWIDLVMKCITSVTYLVIINGSVHGSIVPTRGLKQGDPLSPYLFLLCVEGFSALINEAGRYIHMLGFSKNQPPVLC